jgi:transcriptional regulator
MGESSAEPLRGTIDLLVLRTLSLAPMHGWGITQRIQQVTDGVLEVNQGSLYPALQRLEQKEWIDSEWRITDNNRRAKYYELTPTGRKRLRDESAGWRRLAESMAAALGATAEEI